MKQGDSLSELAERHDTTTEEIRRLNRIKGNKILAGQLLKLPSRGNGENSSEETAEKKVRKSGKKRNPGASFSDEGGKTYKVRRGDNLFRIAVRNGTSVDSLRKANNLGDGDAIQPGQIITIR